MTGTKAIATYVFHGSRPESGYSLTRSVTPSNNSVPATAGAGRARTGRDERYER